MANIFERLRELIMPYNNSERATYMLCQKLNVPTTMANIQKELEEHPDYPSALAISDVLKNYGIDNVAARKHVEEFDEYPCPLIAQLSLVAGGLKDKYFAVVTKKESDAITFYHPVELKESALSVKEFEKIYTGVILIAEAKDHAGEKDYARHLREEKRMTLTKALSAGIIPVLTLIFCAICFFHYGTSSIAPIVYTLLTLMGTTIGALLLWYEVDKHNPVLQQICTGGKKTNCNAVLSSDASKIFGISWSAVGFTYFAGSLISLLASGIYHLHTLFILSWLNVLALPYIVFSLYYQSKIARQWCVLCLTVQAILALQFVTALLGKFHISVHHADLISASAIFTIVISFVIPFLIVSLLLPALRKAKENKQNKNELQRLKHNSQIFESLLAKQKAVTEPTDGLGIVLGNPDARYKLIKVCNPYCGPCAKAHPAIEALLENNPNVQVQIIFTPTNDENDYRNKPVKHLLAIAAQRNEAQTKQALDDWYLADKKDYDVFAAKYPMNGELIQQDDKVKAMSDWCNKMDIAFTPTLFVNGYQLPEIYSVADLKYFLSV